MKIKKILVASLCLAMIISCVACGNSEKVENNYEETKLTEDFETSNVNSIKDSEEANSEESTESSSSTNKSAEEIIRVYNDRIRKEDPNRSQDTINSLIMSYTRQEYVAKLDVTSYEYAVPSNIIGAYIFENADGKANFGGIELNTAVPGGNDESTLSAFMTMCYYFAYGFDTTITEDDFMKIWRDMRNNADSIAFDSGVTYQIQENGQYLSFNIQY